MKWKMDCISYAHTFWRKLSLLYLIFLLFFLKPIPCHLIRMYVMFQVLVFFYFFTYKNFIAIKAHSVALNSNFILFDNTCTESNTDILWNNRFDHMSFVKMQKLSNILVVFSPKKPFICSVCWIARQSRIPFSIKTTTSNQIFGMLHVNLWSPYNVSTHENYKYFLTMVDDFSRCTWTHLLSCKSNAL